MSWLDGLFGGTGKTRACLAGVSFLQIGLFFPLLMVDYWKYFAPWLYTVSSITLGVLGMLSACLGGRFSYFYMLVNFLVFGLVIEPIVMGAEECQAACSTCAPSMCPACCRDSTCRCDYIQFLFLSFGAIMQMICIFLGCTLIPSFSEPAALSPRKDESRPGDNDGLQAPYVKFDPSPPIGAAAAGAADDRPNSGTFDADHVARRLKLAEEARHAAVRVFG